MASVERIERDIAVLKQGAESLAKELESAYADYLRSLGQTLRQQLFLKTYQVCTQGYPTQFLALSLNQRQTLQQNLRQLAHQSQEALLALLQPAQPHPPSEPMDSSQATDATVMPIDSTSSSPDQAERWDDLETSERSPNSYLTEPITIQGLVQWQKALESAIDQELQSLSFKANHLLQQSGILPNKLPEFLKATHNIDGEQIEAISQNILDLLAEAQDNEDDDDEDEDESEFRPRQIAMTIRLMTVHFQLADIEFADNTTSSLRTRLRSLTSRLKKLQHHCRKKERDLAIAQAEAAWRSCWVDE